MQQTLRKIWRVARLPLGVLLVLYIVLVIYRYPIVVEQDHTKATVDYIHAQKITMSDVMGTSLPPVPDEQENNSSIAGIDKNNNGIRDDVELAIFKLHPNEARVRAAELQYAMALQLELTHVFNSDTWIAAAEKNSRAYECIGETYSKKNLKKFNEVTGERTIEVENIHFNSQIRRDRKKYFDNLASSFGIPVDWCDIDFLTLPN